MAFNSEKAAGGAMTGAGAGAAFGPWGALIGGVGGGLLGGFAGGNAGEAERKRQEELMMQTLSEIQGIPLPELKRIQLENPQWIEDLKAETIDQSEMANVRTDPRLQSEQMRSLDALKAIQDGGGMTMADKANLANIQNQAATADKGRRDSIMQSMNQRGMGGSGLELLSNLQSSQAATNQQAQSGLDVAGMAQRRALDAIMQGGQMAGNMRSQDFAEQSRKAEAADAINRFNTQNKMDVNRYNVGGRQDISNAQVNTQNKNLMMPNEIAQQNYDNQMGKAAAMGGARGQQINYYGDRRRENVEADANKWASGAKAVTAVGNYYQNQDERKEKEKNPYGGQNGY